MSTMEERLQRLEQQSEAMRKQLTELRARAEISDLMGRYAVYYSAGCGRPDHGGAVEPVRGH